MASDLQINPGSRFVIQCKRRPVYRRAGLSFVGGRNEALLLGPDSEPVSGVLGVRSSQLAILLADPNLIITMEAPAAGDAAVGGVADIVLADGVKPAPVPEPEPVPAPSRGPKN
ncbi:hypothetical protein ACSN1S_001801, partial [Salmonella enterica subsp. enterica]